MPFGVDSSSSARDLAALHAMLLPMSPLALLGKYFMEKFYYKDLPQQGLIFGAVAYIDDKPAGFIVATHDPAGFMWSGLCKRWYHLAWVLVTSILLKPQSIKTMRKAFQIMSERRVSKDDDRADGEILSLGVLPAYLEPHFIRKTGLRVSADLMDDTLRELKSRGSRLIRALVQADNKPAKFFYMGLGWQLYRSDASEVEFRLRH